MTSPSTPLRAARSSILLAALAVAACSGGDGAAAPPKPASIASLGATTPSATVGAALATSPTFSVKDASGNALANVAVSIVVSGGGGTLVGAPSKTVAGATPVGTWTLGTTAGTNSLTITVAGLAPFTITATGTPGPATKVVATSGNSQTGLAGGTLLTPLEAAVQDQYGNGIANTTVTFSVAAGGGTITPGTLTTNANGVASGASWKLGNKGGTQSATATAGTLTTNYTASIQSTYPIDLRFFGPAMTPEAQAAFVNAANRLRAAIIAAVTPFQLQNINLADCGASGLTGTLNETTSGIIIYAAVAPIDGAGKVLAQAGPCYVRGSSKLPFLATMEFDSADIANYVASGRFEAVVLHEMNHSLGLGTIWDLKNLLVNPMFTYDNNGNPVATGSQNPRFTGATGIANCLAVGGLARHCTVATGIALDSTGGAGTADGHWREQAFDSELMTGFVESTPLMPWSIISIGSFQDLGYTVNTLAADTYQVPSLLALARAARMKELAGDDAPSEVVRRPRFSVPDGGRPQAIRSKP